MGERKNFKPVPNDYRKEQTYAFYPSYEPVVRDRKGERDSINSMWKQLGNDVEFTSSYNSPTSQTRNTYSFEERGYNLKRQRLVNSVGLSVNERHNSPLSVSSSCRFQQCNRTLQAPGRQSAARDTSPPQLRDINSWLSRNTTNSSRSSRPSNRRLENMGGLAQRGCTTHRPEVKPQTTDYHSANYNYKYENTSALSACSSKKSPRRHFFIDPEWVSETLTIKRLTAERMKDPLRYGWL